MAQPFSIDDYNRQIDEWTYEHSAGRIIHSRMDAFDPMKRWLGVQCKKHGQIVDFKVSYLNHDFLDNIRESAIKALEGCSGCRFDKQLRESRFPEGAEL